MVIDYSRKLRYYDASGDLYVVEFIPNDLNTYIKVEKNHEAKDAFALTHEQAEGQWQRLWNAGARYHRFMAVDCHMDL